MKKRFFLPGGQVSIAFKEFFDRLQRATDISSQMDLARALGLNRSAITQAKLRDAVPQKWVLTLARRYSLSPDWLEFGAGAARPGRPLDQASAALQHGTMSKVVPGVGRVLAGQSGTSAADAELERDSILVPKVAARLCAGGGSFEVDAEPVASFRLPRSWLLSLGSPAAMVFMDVVGDSMEPGIQDGDMVLIDRANTRLHKSSIWAVGVEDAIYLKRVARNDGGVVLHSDNPAYSDMRLQGDELDSFRVIGKMVWLCRDYK
jgi:SOS-response transcriptional repressor LexA